MAKDIPQKEQEDEPLSPWIWLLDAEKEDGTFSEPLLPRGEKSRGGGRVGVVDPLWMLASRLFLGYLVVVLLFWHLACRQEEAASANSFYVQEAQAMKVWLWEHQEDDAVFGESGLAPVFTASRTATGPNTIQFFPVVEEKLEPHMVQVQATPVAAELEELTTPAPFVEQTLPCQKNVQVPDFVKTQKYVFVNYFASWCRWSQQLEPIWKALEEAVKERDDLDNVAIVSVDCVEQAELCRQNHILAFPTMQWYQDGNVGTQYKLDRNVPSFLNFIERQVLTVVAAPQDGSQQDIKPVASRGALETRKLLRSSEE